MQQYLHKFLILRRSLYVPQLGNFIIREEAAHIDEESQLLFPPKPVIRFEQGHEDAASQGLYRFLADEMGTDEVTAREEYEEFCKDFRNTIGKDEIAVLPGIGRLVKRHEHDLVFTPETSLLEFLPPINWRMGEKQSVGTSSPQQQAVEESTGINQSQVATPRSLTPKESLEAVLKELEMETQEEEPRDRWWIYAIVLLAAGAIALLFYYQ